jgi:hypothetical protein
MLKYSELLPPVDPPVLETGTLPETVPRNWGEAIAAVQAPVGPTVAAPAYAVEKTLELAAQ